MGKLRLIIWNAIGAAEKEKGGLKAVTLKNTQPEGATFCGFWKERRDLQICTLESVTNKPQWRKTGDAPRKASTGHRDSHSRAECYVQESLWSGSSVRAGMKGLSIVTGITVNLNT